MQTKSQNFRSLFTTLIVLNILFIFFLSYILFFKDSSGLMVAERIDIKDKTGKNRIVISNVDHIPSPIIASKTYQRAVTPAGIIFYDKNGDERGGLAITDTDNIQIMRVFTRIRQMLTDNTDLRLEIEKIKRSLDNQNKNIELIFQYLDELNDKIKRPPLLPDREMVGYKIGGKNKK